MVKMKKLMCLKQETKPKKATKPKLRASFGNQKSTSRSSSRTKSPESESDTESKDDEAKSASRSSSRLSSRGNRSKPLNSLFDLDDSVLNLRKPSKNSKSKLRTTLKLKTKRQPNQLRKLLKPVILKRRKSKNQLRRKLAKKAHPKTLISVKKMFSNHLLVRQRKKENIKMPKKKKMIALL